MTHSIPAHSPGLIWRMMNDGAVLVSPEVGKVRVLNEMGATVWQLIDGQKSVDGIAALLVNEYETSLEQVRADLTIFISDLIDRGLLVWI